MLLRLMKYFTVGSVVVGAGVYSCCYVVRPGERAVIYNRLTGVRDHSYGEGLQFRVLGIEDPKLFNVRLQPRVLQTVTGTKDLQMVNVRLRVLFRPEPNHLAETYRTLGIDYDERVLPSITNEVLKAVVAEFQAEELIVKRDKVSERVSALMRERAKDFHVVLEDISLVDIQFGREFMAAVESKQVAQQEAERFKYVVMENEQHKNAAIVKAEGEATAATLISKALQQYGTGLIELRKIEAAKEIAQSLAENASVTFVPSSGILLNMPMHTK